MVQILTGADSGVKSTLRMPADSELRKLAKVVYAQFPRLDTREELGDQHDLAFKRTFWAVGWLGRLPEVEQKNMHGLTWWSDYLTGLLRDHRIEHEVNGQMLAACILAHGDIKHTITSRWPSDVVFGLTYPFAGRPAGDAWTNVLKGAVLPASPLPYAIRALESRREYQSPTTINMGLVSSTTSWD